MSPAVAFDEHEHSVFDEEEADPNDEDDEEEFDEEDGFDSNEANWARKEALRQGKVLATGAPLSVVHQLCQCSILAQIVNSESWQRSSARTRAD